MGILSFFGFGSSDNKKDALQAMEAAKKASQTLNIEVSIAAHENWLTRLETCIAGRSDEKLDPVHIACDDRCDLGKWIHSDGQKYLGQYAAFNDLKATHKMFHFRVSSIVSLQQAGKIDDARRELSGDIQKLSVKIKQRLTDLKNI